jgi:hypothetical protein
MDVRVDAAVLALRADVPDELSLLDLLPGFDRERGRTQMPHE